MRKLADNVLRALALVVTDRRWAAPLSAMALGFGIFLGVAIGPGAAGTLATQPAPIIALAPSADAGEGDEAEGGGDREARGKAEPEAFSEPFEEETLEPEYAPEPLASEPVPEEGDGDEPSAPAPEEEEVESEARQLEGTVVHANPAAGSYALAIAGGELVSVHAPKLPVPGAKLKVEGEQLANSTFAELESKRAGTAKGATVRGVVTYVDPDPVAPVYTLSGRGSSILVRVPVSPEPQLPALGAYAAVKVGIEQPPAPVPVPEPAIETPAVTEAVDPAPTCLPDPQLQPAPAPTRVVVQRSFEAEPEPATYVDLAGIVTAVCAATGQLLLSADDQRHSGADLLLAVPAKIATDGLELGDSLVATATVGEDGSLALSGLASDERRKGAEDAASAQGDLKR